LKTKTKLYSCCVLYRDHLNPSRIPCSMAKKAPVTLEEVQAALRTKELTKSKDLRVDENGEGLSVSRGNGGGRGNRGSSKGGNKAKYKCFNCHKFGHFNRDCPEDNNDSTQVVSEEYEDAGAMVVCCWEDECEVSHLGIDAL